MTLDKLESHSNQEFEQLLLDKWSHAKRRENYAIPNSLSSSQVHKGVQTESLNEIQMDIIKNDNTNSNGLSSCGISIL